MHLNMTDEATIQSSPAASNARLTALVGAACCAALLHWVPVFEGTIQRAYADPIGILTVCTGDTNFAVLGKAYTKQECTEILDKDLVTAAQGVLKCVPELRGQTYPLAAATSFTFNVGEKAFCNSTMAMQFRIGDLQAACDQFPRWINAGGHPLPGLVKRRQLEREICLGKLQE